MQKQLSKTMADLGLLSVTVFWGTTFILSKLVLTEISLLPYLVIRLTMAALFLGLYSLRFIKEMSAQLVRDGFVLGALLFFSYFFQMWGIQFTSASNAGFITGLNVVLVAVFSILFYGDHPRKETLAGVVLATIGLYLLTGGNLTELNKGDMLVLVCALTVSFHVIYTGKFAPKHNVFLLTSVQLVTTSIFSVVFLIFAGESLPEMKTDVWIVLLYLALFGTIYTFLMQTSMQRFTTATRTALVFSMEPVFASLFAWLIAAESLSTSGWIGGLLIVSGMIIAEIRWKGFNK